MILATLIGAVCTTTGLLLSYEPSDSFSISAPTGPLIIVLAAAGMMYRALCKGSQDNSSKKIHGVCGRLPFKPCGRFPTPS